MSEFNDEEHPEHRPSTPVMAQNLEAPSLPSSLSYKSWAASCPVVSKESQIGGETTYMRAKLCAFCGIAVSCPTSDQSLIEHMKSTACKTIQRDLEAEVRRITKGNLEAREPETTSSLILYGPQSESVHSPLALPTTRPDLPQCQGEEVRTSKSLWANYPWHIHEPSHVVCGSLSFYICSMNRDGDIAHVRSHTCAGVISRPGGVSCDSCAEVARSRGFLRVIRRAMTETPANGLNTKYYSAKQLADLLDDKDAQLKKYRLKGLEANQTARRLLGKLSDHKQFMYSLARTDDVAVGRLVRVALRQGCSVRAIINRVGRAQEGLYHCQTYSKKTIDVALLVLRIGGPRLLYALSKSVDLPSATTVYRHSDRSYLRPSIHFPTLDDVLANIQSICGPAQKGTPGIRGLSVLIDEIALEERFRYSIAEHAVVGVCREHAGVCGTWSMMGRTVSHLHDLKALLDAGKCHRAKEATMVALAPFGSSNYGPMVVLISGTCKTELVEDQKAMISLILEAWATSSYGEQALGPIWSIATDGDSRRRQAIHALCMRRTLPTISPIYPQLHDLPLFNLLCGAGDITHDGDFKHEEKRFASALRSDTGLFVNGTHISPLFIKHRLRIATSIDDDQLDALFNNSDRQNVPKAHTLVKGIFDATQERSEPFQTAHKAFILLGRLLYLFYAPHTTPSMSLSQQMVCLSGCAHILFALFRVDSTNFITSQLYYDVQASIKNAYFCVAKTKVLDPTLPFYLIQTGDDRLENRFGIYRTASSDSNGDLLQMAERSAAAQQIDNILTENPTYDRTPYRIRLESDEYGVDHLNPSSWIGDVCVQDISLRTCWNEGRALAEQALLHAGVEFSFDPGSLCALSGGREVDMMRPFGRFVGVTELAPNQSALTSSIPSTAPSTTAPNPPNPPPSLAVPTDARSDTIGMTLSDLTGLELGSPDEETPLEDLLPPYGPTEIDSSPPLADGPPKRGWVKFEGRWVHLSSAVRVVLGTESKEKSTDRLRRVCGFTRYPSTIDQSDSLLGDICLVDQIVLALVRVANEIALAAVRVTSMRMGLNSHVESISLEHLDKPDTHLTGQILELDCQEGVWYWTQSFVTTASSKGGPRNPTHATGNDTKPLLVKLQARNVELVNPTLSEHHDVLVWSFKHNELVAVIDLLWAKVAEDLHEIPVIGPASNLPYQSDHGKSRLIHFDASRTIEAMPAERCGRCHLCGECVPIKQSMRTHVGKHILAKQLGREDPLRSVPIGDAPCGFCGRPGVCQTSMGKGRSANTVVSDCPFFDKFSYGPAAKTTRSSPCTNRPILCEYAGCLKLTFVWSYNMRAHILVKHGQSEYNHAVHQGLFAISRQEIDLLQLDKPYVVPGRSKFTFPSASTVGTKRPAEDSTADGSLAPSQSVAEPATQDWGGAVASGSGSKQRRIR